MFVEKGRRLFEIRKCGGWQAWARWKGSALPEWLPVTTNGHSICSMPVQPTLSTTTLLGTTTAADGKLLRRRFFAAFAFDLLYRVLNIRTDELWTNWTISKISSFQVSPIIGEAKILSHSERIIKAMIENMMKYAEFWNIMDTFW